MRLLHDPDLLLVAPGDARDMSCPAVAGRAAASPAKGPGRAGPFDDDDDEDGDSWSRGGDDDDDEDDEDDDDLDEEEGSAGTLWAR